MTDDLGQVATRRDAIYSLSIGDAVSLYARAGHPRTPRSIQRYCASGRHEESKNKNTTAFPGLVGSRTEVTIRK
ncbi:MAG: hypothetical protein ACKVP4_05450 [Hyphomicrobium sp.]